MKALTKLYSKFKKEKIVYYVEKNMNISKFVLIEVDKITKKGRRFL